MRSIIINDSANEEGAEIEADRELGSQIEQKRRKATAVQMIISYVSPVFEKSNFAYVQGHDDKYEYQINFLFKAPREVPENKEDISETDIEIFNFLAEGLVYLITWYDIWYDPEGNNPIYTLKANSFTKIEEINPLIYFPPVSPEITKRRITFCNSIDSFENQNFFNIIGRYLGRSDVEERDENDDPIRSGDKVFFELSSGEIANVCLWQERSQGFNFQREKLVIFRWLEKPSRGAIGRYHLKCTFCTSILLLEHKILLDYVPQAKTLIQQLTSQESQEEDNVIENQDSRGNQEERKGQYDEGEFTIMAILRKRGHPVYYPRCNGTKCRKKAKQTGSGWTCGRPEHISQSPTNTLMLRALVRTQKDTYKSVSFLGEMARKLLKEKTQSILELSQRQQAAQRNNQVIQQQQLDAELKNELKKVAGTLVQLSLEKVKNETRNSFGWIVYDVFHIND